MVDFESNDGIIFEESENYRGSQNSFGIREIVMHQLQKCIQEGSKEMSEGGVMNRIVDGRVVEIAMPNQREIFINNVEMLRKLLEPNIKKHYNKIKDLLEEFDKGIEALDEKYKNKRNINMYDQNNPEHKKNSAYYYNLQNKMRKQVRDSYELEKVLLYKDKLLIALSFLLSYINYFEEMVFTEEY